MELYKKARRSILARIKIPKGKIIKEEDIVIKRPGLGIHPSQLSQLIGKIAKIDIDEDEPITWEMI